MTVAKKLILLCACALGALIIVAGVNAWQTRANGRSFKLIVSDILPAVIQLESVESQYWQARTLAWQHLALPRLEQKIAVEHRFDQTLTEIDLGLRTYEQKFADHPEDQRLLREDRKAFRITPYSGEKCLPCRARTGWKRCRPCLNLAARSWWLRF